jgi:hypothetical protein
MWWCGVQNYATSKRPDCKMLFGLDANTYAHPEEDQQGVVKVMLVFVTLLPS